MDKTFQPQDIEQRWYQQWESNGFFTPATDSGQSDQQAFCILIPPPNVTGSLHTVSYTHLTLPTSDLV